MKTFFNENLKPGLTGSYMTKRIASLVKKKKTQKKLTQ